jgi:hypothetical protein
MQGYSKLYSAELANLRVDAPVDDYPYTVMAVDHNSSFLLVQSKFYFI